MARSKIDRQKRAETALRKNIGRVLMFEIKQLMQESHEQVVQYFASEELEIKVRKDDSNFTRDKKEAIKAGWSEEAEFKNRKKIKKYELRVRVFDYGVGYKRMKLLLLYYTYDKIGIFDYRKVPVQDYDKLNKAYLVKYIQSFYNNKYKHNKTNNEPSRFDKRYIESLIIQQNIFQDLSESQCLNVKFGTFYSTKAKEANDSHVLLSVAQSKRPVPVYETDLLSNEEDNDRIIKTLDVIKANTMAIYKEQLNENVPKIIKLQEKSNNVRDWDLTVAEVVFDEYGKLDVVRWII
jgi:hypothetical protein